MPIVRLAASTLLTLIFLGFCVLLWKPSFALATMSTSSGLGSGAFPQFCIISAAVLSVVTFSRDVLRHIKRGHFVDGEGELDTQDPTKVVILGIGALMLLVGYVSLWLAFGFLISTILFLITMSMVLIPGELRTSRKAYLSIIITGVLFGVICWATFVYVLGVPLR